MKKLYLLVFVTSLFYTAQAQIRINLTNVDDWVRTNFVGQGVVIGNIKTHLAGKEAVGTFINNGILQLKSGLVLSTGDVRRIPGVNDQYNQSTGFNHTGKPEKDKDLQKIEKGNLFDISYIEFDFVPYNNSISFNYQFGSDEYPEYVGSAFNDVFAFIVTDGDSAKNIALIPGKNTPVSINTVNYKTDSAYFIDNNVFAIKNVFRNNPDEVQEEIQRSKVGKILFAIKKFFSPRSVEDENQITMEPNDNLIKQVDNKLYKNLQYDGITKKLIAQTFVQPYKRYHLKIIIADVTDNIYDSGVFLEQGSLTTQKDTQQPGFVDYPDLSQQIDVQRILKGEKLQDILNPQVVENKSSIKKAITTTNNSSDKINTSPIIVYFDFDQSEIADTEKEKLKLFSQDSKTSGRNYQIEIIGHTDNKGSLKYNLALSAKRSNAVAAYLKLLNPQIKISKKISKAFLIPASTNDTDQGRALNRRVEVNYINLKGK